VGGIFLVSIDGQTASPNPAPYRFPTAVVIFAMIDAAKTS
jgi:hypothetical protein